MLPKLLLALKQENCVAVFISKADSSLPRKTHIQNYQLCYGQIEVHSLNFPPYFFLFIYNESHDYLRFQDSLMHLLSESLRPRVVIYYAKPNAAIFNTSILIQFHIYLFNSVRICSIQSLHSFNVIRIYSI